VLQSTAKKDKSRTKSKSKRQPKEADEEEEEQEEEAEEEASDDEDEADGDERSSKRRRRSRSPDEDREIDEQRERGHRLNQKRRAPKQDASTRGTKHLQLKAEREKREQLLKQNVTKVKAAALASVLVCVPCASCPFLTIC
jgi:hypothetical protein